MKKKQANALTFTPKSGRGETHLIEILRAPEPSLVEAGREYSCLPPDRGRYEITPGISVPVADVRLIAVEHDEK